MTDVLVGWDKNPDVDHYPPNGKFPPGVWINVKNPVPAISMQQLQHPHPGIPGGDITRWSEIGFHEVPVGNNGADYAKREIYLLADLARPSGRRDGAGPAGRLP